MRTVLVTGASTGIGAATAKRLAAGGWRVIAGVRKPGDAPPGIEELILDVTDPSAIAAAADRIPDLDGLVNNAGIAVAGPLEYLPLDELRRQLEINLIGQLAVTQAFLPALRAGTPGRVVFVGSIAGKSALPFLGAYAMSKHALEALADSLRVELGQEGIGVTMIEPGTIKTAIWTKPQPVADSIPPEGVERYGKRIQKFRELAQGRGAKGAPADAVARQIERALTATRPAARVLVGRDAKIRRQVERLPSRTRDRLVTRVLLGRPDRQG